MAKKFPCVKLVSGPRHLGLVPQAAAEITPDCAPRFFMDDDPRALIDLEVAPTSRANPFKAYVTITYGCDRFCSYCIVPYVRGRLQSRAHEDILKEVRTLIDGGAREITLLGAERRRLRQGSEKRLRLRLAARRYGGSAGARTAPLRNLAPEGFRR